MYALTQQPDELPGLALAVYIWSTLLLFCAKISKYTGYVYGLGQPYELAILRHLRPCPLPAMIGMGAARVLALSYPCSWVCLELLARAYWCAWWHVSVSCISQPVWTCKHCDARASLG